MVGGRIRRLLGAVAVLGLLLGPGASPTFACISESPTFAEVISRADTIARVTIVDGTDHETQRDIEAFRVERVLKGDPGPLIELVNPMSGLCGDRIGVMTSDHGNGVGQTIILATDVEFFGEVLDTFWHVGDGGIGGAAGVPVDVEDLADLEAAILAALRTPDTSTVSGADSSMAVGPDLNTIIVIVAAIVLSALMIRRWFSSAG